MALTGEDKEMRMPAGSLGYESLENLDQHTQGHHHQQQQQQHEHLLNIQQEKSRGGGGGGGNGFNSGGGGGGGGGSKSRTPTGRNSATNIIRYRECLKNHAASTGGNVTDGCGEFMPSGEEGTLEAFKCAACNCHRNFHRKESNGGGGGGGGGGEGAIMLHPLHLPSAAAIPSPSWTTTMVQPVKMAFRGGGGGSASAGTDSSSEELNFNTYHSTSIPPPPQFVLAKKRFRTKFSQEQKDKMLAFAEKLGWRIPREDDTEVQRFCAEVGVKRQVFKVWMHNNKNSSAKKNPLQESS
ncbi:hypothetical protein M9H77_24861 [Catharanthus roseus]|uniref:Uncharacterized protein n=1 Tax=Catharanthus roseus TaxID=4058 RepID=A0ACC0A592_CATRO|nr:hypothetical protein M9H77_24861 [Catharanthus roseus]